VDLQSLEMNLQPSEVDSQPLEMELQPSEIIW